MMATEAASVVGLRTGIANSLILLVMAFIPWPEDWELALNIVDGADLQRSIALIMMAILRAITRA